MASSSKLNKAGMDDMHGLGEDLFPFPIIIGDNRYTFFKK